MIYHTGFNVNVLISVGEFGVENLFARMEKTAYVVPTSRSITTGKR